MTQKYQTLDKNLLFKWILLLSTKNYTVEKHDGKLWLYDHNGEMIEYIDGELEEN